MSVLQVVENLTDRQAAHAVRARIEVRYRIGREQTDPGFDHTAMGLVTSGGRQRADSTTCRPQHGWNRSCRNATEGLSTHAGSPSTNESDAMARQIAADGHRLLEAVFAPAALSWLREIPTATV
nr:transposase [Embleya hyalina]